MRSLLAAQVKLHEVSAHRARVSSPTSGHTSVVITAVFGAYFVGVLCDKRPWCTFAWIFGSDEKLIAAFLPELADSQAMGRVSGGQPELRLPGRARFAGNLPGLHQRLAAKRAGGAVRPDDDADHGGLFRGGRDADVSPPLYKAFFSFWVAAKLASLCTGSSQAARSSAISRAAVARRRVPRAMGAFSQDGVDLRTADLRRGEPDLRQQPPPRQPGDAHLLRHWPCASRRVRPQGGARHGNRHEVRPSTDTLQRT